MFSWYTIGWLTRWLKSSNSLLWVWLTGMSFYTCSNKLWFCSKSSAIHCTHYPFITHYCGLHPWELIRQSQFHTTLWSGIETYFFLWSYCFLLSPGVFAFSVCAWHGGLYQRLYHMTVMWCGVGLFSYSNLYCLLCVTISNLSLIIIIPVIIFKLPVIIIIKWD